MDLTAKKYLKERLSGELPGFRAHAKMLPPGRRLKTSAEELSQVKQSSVLVLLFPCCGELCTCLTQRPVTMKHHPGQISFPGGRVEDDDSSAEMTALREAREEVGLDSASVEVLGKLSDLYVEVSKFSIQPYLAWVDQKPSFVINSDEVEELILFPVSQFVVNEIVGETEIQTFTGLLKVKYYPLENKCVWGATAMILSELIEILKESHSIPVHSTTTI